MKTLPNQKASESARLACQPDKRNDSCCIRTPLSALDSAASHSDAHPLILTLIDSRQPSIMTKRFTLDSEGHLHKSSVAELTDGRATQKRLVTLIEFAELLEHLESNQVLLYGIAPEHPHARVVTQRGVRASPAANQIARTREFFQFAPLPGVLMLDHDGLEEGKGQLSPDELRARLIEAAPVLADAPMLWRASASSGIMAPDGRALTQLGGQRLYIPVRDASKIPNAGKALIDLLWASGQGWVRIGAAGQALDRSLFDGSVWQPERLDFAAPPALLDGLTRRPPAPRFFNEAAPWFDLCQLIQCADGTVKTLAHKARDEARRAVKPKQEEVRTAWVKERAPELAQQRNISEDLAREILLRACEKRRLMGDFMLRAADGAEVSVGELLDNPERWHGKRFADPLEPGYDNDGRIAWANLRNGARPHLYSHAHGGVRYHLLRPSQRIQLAKGQRARVVDNLLDLARQRGELYDFGEGSSLARIAGTRVVPVTRDWLVDHLDRTAEFFSAKTADDGAVTETAQDAPMWSASAIIAKNGERRLPYLSAVITAPILRTDGSIVANPGHDPESGLLYLTNSLDGLQVPERPTTQQALAALTRLWAPVRSFPLADDVDRGVILAALLTACLRPSLPTAPGFGFDAPAAGTGKTLLAQTIGALGTGNAPATLPPAGNQDEECRKRLFAALRGGDMTVLWDNVRDVFGNSAIDAFLTAPVFADRILGVSETASLPNRALFLVTGNNLRLAGDTCRRVLVARMNASMDTPYTRSFAFDPLQTVLGNRESLVIDALTIVRAWIATGRPHLATGRTASFEAWDELVRQPVVWIAKVSQASGLPGFADPLEATKRAFEHDPETAKLAALIAAWHKCFADHPTTVAEVVTRASGGACDEASLALGNAVDEIASERGTINRRILGRWIERHVDRRYQGRWFTRGKIRTGSVTWILVTEKSTRTDQNKATYSHQTHQALRREPTEGLADAVGLVALSGFLPGSSEQDFIVEEEL